MNFQFSTFFSPSSISPFLLVASLRWLFFGAWTAIIIVHECWMSFFPPACRLVSLCRRRWGGLELHDKKWTSHSQCWTTSKMSRNGNIISTSLPLFLRIFYSSSRCCRYDVVVQRRTQSFTILPLSRSSSSFTDSSRDLIKFYFKRQTMMSWEKIAAAVKRRERSGDFLSIFTNLQVIALHIYCCYLISAKESMDKNYM